MNRLRFIALLLLLHIPSLMVADDITIQVQNAASTVGTYKKYLKLNFVSGVTCAVNNSTGALDCTGAAGSGTNVNGSSVASPNFQSADTPYRALTADKFFFSGSNISANPYVPSQGGLLCLGDSITSKTSSGGTYGYCGLMNRSDFTGWYFNRGLANDMAPDMALKCFDAASSNYVVPNIDSHIMPALISIMIGTNDATLNGNASYQAIYGGADMACMAFLGIPRIDTLYMQDAAVTKAGGFAADNTVLSGLGEKSTTAGATLTFSVTGNGNPLEVTYVKKDGSTGTWHLSIDGVTQTDTIGASSTVASVGGVAISTTNGATTSPSLARYPMTAGAHSIVITTDNNGENNILSAGVAPLSTASEFILAPRIWRWGVIRQQASANETWTTNYNTQASADCTQMSNDGIACQFIADHSTLLDTDFTDAKHPNDSGHGKLWRLTRPYSQGGGGNSFYYITFPYIPNSSPWPDSTAKIFAAQNSTTLYLGTNEQTGTTDVNLGLHNLMSENAILLYTSGLGAQRGGWFTGSGELDLSSVGSLGFANVTSAADISSVIDSRISRLGAASFAFGNNTVGDFSGTLTHTTDVLQSGNGAQWVHGQNSELLTIAAAATTDTAGNLLPANSVIEAVVVRVTTIIPTAATFSVGDATTAARFATGVAVAANTTAVGLTAVDQTGAAGPKQTAAAKVRITPNATPGTATGVVRITVYYRQLVAPTS